MTSTRRQFLRDSSLATASGLLALHGQGVLGAGSLKFYEYRQYDGLALADLVKQRKASPRELLELAINCTTAVNPQINAVVAEHYELARESIRQGLPDGPFRGVPFLLKDLGVALQGTITSEGSRYFKDQLQNYDSTVVARYKQAGLVIFGKTHSPEFGQTATTETQLFGNCHNPWDLTRSTGGSSGGAAAAVAAGILPVAHASDGGGSIRIPASACGLFGIKPTRGRVPMGPAVYESRDGLSHQHVVSRSVRDSAALLDITQGGEAGDPYPAPTNERSYLDELQRPPGKLRIALMTEPLFPLPVAPDCVAAAESAARLCAELGHNVEIARPQLDLDAIGNAMGVTSNVLVAAKIAAREKVLGRPPRDDELEKINHLNLANGRKVDAVSYAQARNVVHLTGRRMAEFMQQYDVVLSPTMAIVPPRIGVLSLNQPYENFMMVAAAASGFTSLYNMTGQPAMTVPLYWNAENIPVGVQFAARFGDDATLFRLAAQLEEAAPWFDKVAPFAPA